MFKRIFGFLANITKVSSMFTSLFKALIMMIGQFKLVKVGLAA